MVGQVMGWPTAIVIGREMRMTTISIADELSGTMPLKRGFGGYYAQYPYYMHCCNHFHLANMLFGETGFG